MILTEHGTTSYSTMFARDGSVVISIGAAPMKEGSLLLQATHIQVVYLALEEQDQGPADTCQWSGGEGGSGHVDECLQTSKATASDAQDANTRSFVYHASRHRRKLQERLLHAMNLASSRFGLSRTHFKKVV